MTNSRFAKSLAALLVLTATLFGVSQQGQESNDNDSNIVQGPEVEWDLSLWGTTRPGTRVAESIAEHLSDRTGGNWKLTVHYGEALSKSRENLDGISIGAFEAAMVCNFYHPQKNPGLMVLSLPFLPINSFEDGVAVRNAVYAHEQVKKEMERWGAMIYSTSNLPSYEIMGRGQPPLRLADWKGMSVRAGGGIGEVMKKLGATPTSSTATEVYTGLQLGTMDAAAFPFTYAHVSYRLHEVAEWFTSNMAPGTADCPIVFSIKDYEKLPTEYKDLLEQIRNSVLEDQRLAYEEIDKQNLPLLQGKLREITYTEEELQNFRDEFGRLVIEEWIEDNERRFDARGLVESIFTSVGQKYN